MRVAIKSKVLKGWEPALVPELGEQRCWMSGVCCGVSRRLYGQIHVGYLYANISCGEGKAGRVNASEGRECGNGWGERRLTRERGRGINGQAVQERVVEG